MGRGVVSDLAGDLPNIDAGLFRIPNPAQLCATPASTHPPRILLLYGSLRARSFSRLMTEEAARLLRAMGAETRIFNPSGLPLPDDAPDTHPKVAELRELTQWAEGMVWCSPERHGAMTGIMKAQIDWIPLSVGAVRPTQGKTLALMQVCGGSQSFNAVNQMRVLGRWMRHRGGQWPFLPGGSHKRRPSRRPERSRPAAGPAGGRSAGSPSGFRERGA